MLKMTIDNEEVLSNNDISIKEEILSPSSTILNNVYPKTWEQDKDYVSRFYYPKDYSKLNIQNFSVEPEEAGTTIQVNGSATLTDVDTTKESRVLALKGQTSQNGTPTPSSPIPVNVVSGDNEINICGKNFFDIGTSINDYFATNDNGVRINTSQNISTYVSATFDNNTITITNYNNSGYRWLSKLVKLSKNTTYTISSGVLSNTVKVCGCNSLADGTNATQLTAIDNINLKPPKTFNSGNYKYYYIAIYPQQANNVFPNIMINNSSDTTYEPYIGHSYPIYLGVENLFNLETADHVSISGTGAVGSNEDYRTTKYLPTQPNTNYYFSTTQISGQTSKQIYLCYYNSSQTFISRDSYNLLESKFTTPANCYYIRAGVYSKGQENIKLTEGDHLQYISNNPIELCKIGTYQDYIYKDNGKWYLHKEIGKVVLDGSEQEWGYTQTGGINRFTTNAMPKISNYIKGYSDTNRHSDRILCTHFKGNTTDAIGNMYQYQRTILFDANSDITSTSLWLTWLSNNLPTLYFVLETPTNTEITDTLLLSQLNDLESE